MHELKVTADHLKRDAYLYVRQSTLRQVAEHGESTQRQYALRDRAIAAGWPIERVIAFWEAKTFDDGRLRGEPEPEVIGQLLGNGEYPGYVGYLNVPDHRDNIRDAYVQTCSVLARLHQMKRAVSPCAAEESSLHPLVVKVAKLAGLPMADISSWLRVNPKPGLAIYSDGNKVIDTDKYWPPHRDKIERAGITIVESQRSKDIILQESD